MAYKNVATMLVAAAVDGAQVGRFTVGERAFRGGVLIPLSVNGLAGAETATLWYKSDDEWKAEGTVFDTNVGVVALQAPGEYGFTKDVSVGALTVWINDGR